MSGKRFCAECGTPIPDGENFCPECGTKVASVSADLQSDRNPQSDDADNKSESASRASYFGSGSRINIAGGLTQHQESHHTENTSHVNNSQNVTNIVMEQGTKYCEVCGRMLDGQHARCPKCGKTVCMDCMVKGKNRCTQCEKKACDELRLFVRELLISTGGDANINTNLLHQKARELDIDDRAEDIAVEALQTYFPVTSKQQSQAAENHVVETRVVETHVVETPVIVPVAIEAPKPKNKKKFWLILALVAVFVLVALLLMLQSKPDDIEMPDGTDNTETLIDVAVPDGNEPATPTGGSTNYSPENRPGNRGGSSSSPVVKSTDHAAESQATPVTTTSATDADYDAGMAYYESGDGNSAISSFEKSTCARAKYMIGIIYESGCGNVPVNAMKARTYFKQAAKMGCAEAKAKL